MKKSGWQWINKSDIFLFYVTLFCLGMLVISQIILLFQAGRVQLSRIDRLEGQQISLEIPPLSDTPMKIVESQEVTNPLQFFRSSQVIIIRMISPMNNRSVFVTVNGKVVENFDKGEVHLNVYDGDYIEINATSLKQLAHYIVNVPGTKVISPVNGIIVETRGTITVVGQVKLKK